MYSSVLFFKPGVETALNINNYGQVNITEKQGYQNNGYGRDDRDRRRDDDRKRDNDHDGWHH
jgi:hypothetical protein